MRGLWFLQNSRKKPLIRTVPPHARLNVRLSNERSNYIDLTKITQQEAGRLQSFDKLRTKDQKPLV